MKIVNGMIELEQVGWPGNIGDSCAETCRAIVLGCSVLSSDAFISPTGFLRHPTAPEGWRESDFSCDQLLPLQMVRPGLDTGFPKIRGTNTLLSIGCIALRFDLPGLLDLVNQVQGWLLHFPWRWDDSKMRIERSAGSTADYLNYAIICIYLGKKPKLPVGEIMAAVESYYRNEPGVEWLIALYRNRLNKLA